MKTAPDFLLARKLPLNARFALIAALTACGIVVQLYASAFAGWVAVLLASMLGAMRGRSNKPKNLRAGEWRSVTMEEIKEVQEFISRTRHLDSTVGPFQLGSCIGCGTFIVMAAAAWIAVVVVGAAPEAWSSGIAADQLFSRMSKGLIFGVDAVTLLMPLWLFGRVNTWQPPGLSMRLEQMLYVYGRASADPNLEFQPSLQVAGCEGGSVPTDCRLVVRFRDSSPDFTGIQLQTAINTVQGTGYPYTYCVLIAKPAFKLLEKAKAAVEIPPRGGFPVGWLADTNAKKEARFPRYLGAVIEMDREADVEIVVVRQPTGGRGYTTSSEAALDIFNTACSLARKVLEF